MNGTLPALRRKILSGHLIIVFIFGIAGTLLVLTAVYVATGLTPKIVHRNYDSIEAARKMQQAWVALNFENASYPLKKSEHEWIKQFDNSIAFELSNITEEGEEELAKSIEHNWQIWKDYWKKSSYNVADENFGKLEKSEKLRKFEKLEPVVKITNFKDVDRVRKLYKENNLLLEKLVLLNEKGMFGIVQTGNHIRYYVIMGVAFFFLVCFIITIFIADSLSIRLSTPIKEICEVLRSRPKPGENIKLPIPSNLELQILIEELRELWERIGQLDKLNVEKIIQQSSYLEGLLSSVEDAVLVVDTHEIVTHVSGRMAQLLGLSKEMIIGFKWNDLSTGSRNYFKIRQSFQERKNNEHPTIDLDIRNRVSEEMPIRDIEIEATKVSDAILTFSGRFRDVLSSKGNLISTIFLLHDITELKNRERLKAEFIEVLSHELKTPIQSLGTAIELLNKGKASFDARTVLLIETISEDIARIRAVANQFMQVGQLSGKVARLKLEKEQLSKLLPEWLRSFEVLASDKGIFIEYKQEGEETIYGMIDKLRFPWVISNLLSNSIRISPNNSKIEVLLTEKDNFIEIRVTDQGPGIPIDTQKRMYEPYFQGNITEIAGSAGFLGLGLTIVKDITEAHGGRVEYTTAKLEGANSGASFRLLLPSYSENLAISSKDIKNYE